MSRDDDQIRSYEQAILLFHRIEDWKDSRERIELCQKKISEIQDKEEAARQERQRQVEEVARAQKQFEKLVVVVTAAILVVVMLLILIFAVFVPNVRYREAIALMEEGKYHEAALLFQDLKGYRDSEEKLDECRDAMTEDFENGETS